MRMKTFFSAAVLHTAFLFPYSGTWNIAAPSPFNWSVATNWTPAGGPPQAAGDSAAFPNGAGALTVTVDMPSFIVGTLAFTNTTNAYNLTGTPTNTLNLQGSAGTASITNNTATVVNTISAGMVLTNPLTITQNSVQNFVISGIMSGPSSLTLAGTGVTVFSGVNTYSGGTNVPAATQLSLGAATTIPPSGTLAISGGTVTCTVAGALNPAGAVNLSSGTLNINNLSQAIGQLSGTGGTITLGSATLTSNATTTSTYAGTISGTGGFTLGGSGGTFSFNATPGYTGTTTVNGSTLLLAPSAPLPSAGNLTVSMSGIFNMNNINQTVATLSGTGSGSILLGSGTLISSVASPSTSSFSGTISGSGGFTLSATGVGTNTLTLLGNSNYTGPTTINSSTTLQLGINNALPSLSPVTIAGGTLDMTPPASTVQAIGPLTSGNALSVVHLGATQLTITETASTSFVGTIDGSGSLVMAGPQTLTLGTTGGATYTGGTFVTGGTLLMGNPGTLPTAGNLTVSSPGTLNMNNFAQTVGTLSGNGNILTGGASGILTVLVPSGQSSTFSGVISQGGSLVVGNGAPLGTLILTGPNTYSNGTTVHTNATLQGNSTSLQGAISNSGNLIFNQTFSGTYSGPLTGAGTLTITGGGNLTLTGSPTQGNTIVSAGRLSLGSGATLTSPVTVSAGASLASPASSTIIGNVNVSGTTQLGLGTLSVTGTYAQSAGSTYGVELSASPGNSSLLAASGPVTLSGSPSLDIGFNPGAFSSVQTYTIMTSPSISGTFAPPILENPFFQATVVQTSTMVQVILRIAPFSNVITGGNAGAIAKCINLEAFPQETEILPIIDTLIFLPIKEVKKALDVIQPSQLKALGLTEENNLVVIRSSVSQHVDDFYKTDCNKAMAELYNWSTWGNFSGDFLRQEGQTENIGYSATTAGVTAGIDGAVGKNMFLGAAMAYDYSWLDWSNSRGHGSISSIYLGPYYTWFNHRVYTNASLLGTFNTYKASRHIDIPGFDMHARNHHHGGGLIGHFDLGIMLYPSGGMTVSPLAGVDYIHLWERGYTEQGAPGLNMKISPTHASLVRTELGLEIAKCAVLIHNKWTHDLKLSWIHQFPLKGSHLNAQFADVNCTYRVKGLVPNQDYLDIATGLTGLFMKDRLSAALRYEGKFGDGIRDNTAYTQITYRF